MPCLEDTAYSALVYLPPQAEQLLVSCRNLQHQPTHKHTHYLDAKILKSQNKATANDGCTHLFTPLTVAAAAQVAAWAWVDDFTLSQAIKYLTVMLQVVFCPFSVTKYYNKKNTQTKQLMLDLKKY